MIRHEFFSDGVSQFIDAIHRVARVHPIHQSIIVTIDQQLVRICSCGWSSLPVVSYALAEQTECPVWLAEIERHVRANRRGADVIAALEVLVGEARDIAHVGESHAVQALRKAENQSETVGEEGAPV